MKLHSEVDQIRGLDIHAIVFVLTMALLGVINLLTGSPYWVLWVLLGWSTGLVAHWAYVRGPAQHHHDSAA